MNKNIIKIDYKEEMEQSYIDYAMSVIIQRAIPDLRDGLKPVHRRILYAMTELNLEPEKPFKKSARIIGDVLGKYHPHGDSSVYEAMVRLAQDFNTNHPLVLGQGNFGSIDGDPAAAMRYTEAKLESLSMSLLKGLDKDTIEYQDNFDNSLKEPSVLPARFFNLLVNGSTGIAVGMSTNIPPHNLNEVNNACKAYLKNKNITNAGLLRYIKGPDFPTGGTIINKDDIKKIYETGNGRIRVRANFELEDLKGGRKNLIITEIPYTFAGSKTRLIESFINLVNDRKLDELSDVRDESSKDGIRIVLEVKRGIDIDMLKSKLYQTTRLEDTVPVNLLSIVDNRPAVFSIRELIEYYCEFLISIYIKEINFDLNKLKYDREINEGLIKAYNKIDLIIEIIRGSKKREDVVTCLTTGDISNINLNNKSSQATAKELNFTQNQAESIMKLQLQRLVGLEIDKIKETLEEINKKIDFSLNLLENEDELRDYIIVDLDDIKKKYGHNRKTQIKQIDKEDKFVEEEVVEELYALIDRFNYVKVVDTQSYSRTNKETLESYKYIVKIHSNDNLWIFSDDINFHQIKIKDLPVSKMADRGTPLPNNINLLFADSEENLKDKELLFTTKFGYVKRIDSSEFQTIRRELISTRLSSEDDELISVNLIDDNSEELVLITNDNRKIRFNVSEVSKQKRMAMGVIGINLNQDDYVIDVKLEEKTDKDKRNRGAKGFIIK